METIGKYHIVRVLGRGGMGTVYEAVDPVIHRKVALKTMIPELAETAELRARFLREAQAAGGLRHRNIVTVYDLGEDKGRPYIAMEFIEGTDLEKIIQNREPLPIEWKLDVLRQICEGLSHAHRTGIVHRDVKPANIRVTARGRRQDHGLRHRPPAVLQPSPRAAACWARCTTWRPSRWTGARSTTAPTSSRWAPSPTSCCPTASPSTATASPA